MKFDFKHCALAMGLAALMTACSGGSKPTFETEWMTYSDDDGETYGFFNPGSGKTMYKNEFSNRPTSIVDGIFILREDGGVAVYGADNKTPKVLGDLEELNDAGGVAEGLLPVCRKNSRIEVYSVSKSKSSLAFALDPVGGKEITGCSGAFAEGLLIVKNEDDKWGAVDKTGQVAISFEYTALFAPVKGMLIAKKDSDGGSAKCYLIDTKGEEILKFKKGVEPISILDNGYVYCKNDNGRCVLATKKGEYISLPKSVDYIEGLYGDYIPFSDGGKYGILKLKGEETEVVVRAKYQALSMLPWDHSKYLGTKDGDDYAVYDFEGDTQINFKDKYEFVLPVTTPNWKGFVAELDDSDHEFVFIDTDGKEIKYDGVHGLYSLGVGTSYSSSLSSDYFNVSDFARQLSDAISTSGLCGYKLGVYANQYYTYSMEPRNFTYTYWFTPEAEPDVKGYKYSSSIRLSAEKRLADYSWNSYSYEWSYYWQSNNPLDGMELTVNIPYGKWDAIEDEVKDVITSKGFTEYDTESGSVVYYTPSRDAKLTLKWHSSYITLTFFKNYEEVAAE